MAARYDGSVGEDLEQPEGRDPSDLSLQHQRFNRDGANRGPHQPPRFGPEQDLAGRSHLFQPGGDVDGVTGDQALPRRGIAGDNISGVDAGPDLEPDAAVSRQLVVERSEARAHLRRRAHGAQRVVLVQLRDPENRHDRVADELLHRAAVALDHCPHGVEIAPHDIAERFRVQALAKNGRARHIREHHRHRLAGRRRWRGGVQLCAAS